VETQSCEPFVVYFKQLSSVFSSLLQRPAKSAVTHSLLVKRFNSSKCACKN